MVSRPARVTPVPPPEVKKIKVCLLGDPMVGKSAFAKVFAQEEFPENYAATVGSDFFMRNMEVGSANFQFNLWDLSGDPAFTEVRNEFFKESHALLLFYDITKRRSFENLNNWMGEASRAEGGANLPVYVVGTRLDLDDRRAVPASDAEKWTKQKGYVGYFDVSAKENININTLFRELATSLP